MCAQDNSEQTGRVSNMRRLRCGYMAVKFSEIGLGYCRLSVIKLDQ